MTATIWLLCAVTPIAAAYIMYRLTRRAKPSRVLTKRHWYCNKCGFYLIDSSALVAEQRHSEFSKCDYMPGGFYVERG